MYVSALLVARRNSGVSVAVLCPRLMRRRKKERVCLSTSLGDEQRRCIRRMLPYTRLWSGPLGCEECGGR